jgi:hypothetical protein
MNLDEIKARTEQAREDGIGLEQFEDLDTLIAEVERLREAQRWIRNELCLKCGRYREAHNGACDGCRWKEDLHEI